MFMFGRSWRRLYGTRRYLYVMIAQGLAIPALIVLGANIWTTNDNALYTGGLGLSNITKIRKRPHGARVRRNRYCHGDLALQQFYRLAQLLERDVSPPIGAHHND